MDRSLLAWETNFLKSLIGIPLPKAYGMNQKSNDRCSSSQFLDGKEHPVNMVHGFQARHGCVLPDQSLRL